MRGGRDSNTPADVSPSESTITRVSDSETLVAGGILDGASTGIDSLLQCTNVPNDPIGAALASARAAWGRSHERRQLRRALLDVLRLLEDEAP